MVSLQTIQAHNATLKTLALGLVAVFGKFKVFRHSTFYNAHHKNISCSWNDLSTAKALLCLAPSL